MRRFFLAVCDSFAFCLLFLLLAALLCFIFCSVVFLLVVVTLTRTRPEERRRMREIHGLQFFSALNFRFFNFLFCLCVFYPPTRCCRCHNADLKHLFCIFVMCVLFFFCSPFYVAFFWMFEKKTFKPNSFLCCASFLNWKTFNLIFNIFLVFCHF